MPFITPILVFGTAAFSIPLIIHLLNRRRFKTVQWAAMHLLTPIMKKNNRRLTLEQLLLLLIRIAIPIVLALCLARPVFTDTRIFGREAKSSKVFLVDDSYSMQAGDGAGTRFTHARDFVLEIIRGMRDGSDASIVFMGGRPAAFTDEPTSARDELARDFRDVTRVAPAADPSGALLAAVAELGQMDNVAREIVVLSDFQARDWAARGSASRRDALDQLNALPVKPVLTFVPIRQDTAVENIAVEAVETSRLVVGVGQPLTLRVNVRNHGRSARPAVEVRLEIDGKPARTTRIRLEPDQSAQVLFTAEFDTPGDHAIKVELGHDAIPADNAWFASVPVWDEVPVLLVDGDPDTRPLASETDFLRLALRPFSAARIELRDLIVTETVESQRFNERDTENRRVIVVANAEELRDDQVRALEKFVSNGGGLIVFPGDRTKFDVWNRRLFRDGKGLLPAQFDKLAGEIAGGAPTRIRTGRFDHAAMHLFNDARNGDPSKAALRSWVVLKPKAEGVTKIASLQSGDVLAVEHTFGEGRVLQMAVPADADWGNFPAQPEFVPMMQRFVVHLATSAQAERDLAVGKTLTALLPSGLAGKNLEIERPSGRSESIEVRNENGRGILDYQDTRSAGHYTLRLPDGKKQIFAANFPREESDITLLGEDPLVRLAEESDAAIAADIAAYTELDKNRRVGVEFWKPLLIVLLALILSEILLQQWIGRRRLKPAKAKPRARAPQPAPAA